MMKKIFAGFVAVLMSVFATGCRNHSEDSDNNGNNDTAVTTEGDAKNADQKENGKAGNGGAAGDKAKETEAAEAVTTEEVTYVYDEAGNIDIDLMPDITEAPVTEAPAEEKKPAEEQGEQTLEYTEDGDIIV